MTEINFRVSTAEPIHEISELFLSHTIDASILQKKEWRTTDFNASRLLTLCHGLSPCYLRFGGNASNRLKFITDSSSKEESSTGIRKLSKDAEVKMTASDWIKLNEFAKKLNWRILFCLNPHTGKPNGWDTKNAEELLQFTREHGYSVDWSLGNEPHKSDNISGSEMGSYFLTLNSLINTYFSGSKLVGPDLSRLKRFGKHFLKDFLDTCSTVLTAVSFHQYYVDGRTAVWDNFVDPEILDSLTDKIGIVREIVHEVESNLPTWITETSSAYGGGAPDISDSFVASFCWLDKLGISALKGVQVVMRQSLLTGRYRLIRLGYEPNPDYWLSFVYKRLVGTKVFSVSYHSHPKVRIYCHSSLEEEREDSASYVVMALNLGAEPVGLLPENEELKKKSYECYILQSNTPENLLSKSVLLNGKVLEMVDDTTMPVLNGIHAEAGSSMRLPSYSYGFFVF